nr:hypothetical protein [uncultured Shuttleworthia sp.]
MHQKMKKRNRKIQSIKKTKKENRKQKISEKDKRKPSETRINLKRLSPFGRAKPIYNILCIDLQEPAFHCLLLPAHPITHRY